MEEEEEELVGLVVQQASSKRKCGPVKKKKKKKKQKISHFITDLFPFLFKHAVTVTSRTSENGSHKESQGAFF